MIYLDFEKAFHKVPHYLPVEKIQCFDVHEKNALEVEVTFKCNSGSILGPLLLSLYINDMLLKLTHSTITLFEDGSSCYSINYPKFQTA